MESRSDSRAAKAVALKPCPFCAHPAPTIIDIRGRRYIECVYCEARGPVELQHPGNSAANRWNRRDWSASDE